MSGTQPVALYAAKVPPGGILVPAVPNASAMFRVTMAAIDPDAVPEFEDEDQANKPPRATLKIVRPPPGMDLGDDEEDYSDDEDEYSSEEEENGGPSDPAKQKKAKLAAALKEMEDNMDEDDEDEDDDDEMSEDALKAAISKLIKGKGKASDDSSSDGSGDLELEEVVVCTLDPEKTYQQTLDFVVAEDERIFFKVTGTHTVYLTGNYVMPAEEGSDIDSEDEDEDEDEDYDMSPDEDELALLDDGDESDSLDDLENPRVMEIDTDEEEAPKQAKQATKGKNKRTASELTEATSLDDMMSKELKSGQAAAEPKLSKKQQKKLKKNNGEAVDATPAKTAEPTKEQPAAKSEKKVQFAKNLEQGPTRKADAQPAGTLGRREIQGVGLDDRKLGQGRAAKKGDTVSMRYIGKLENGKVFDSNKKGKPFSFKLGSGEVIKGWEIGIPGMAVGGERRVSVPPHHAYGRQSLPGIPANSKLIFDVKLLGIK